jgi:hypothetical protein
MRKHYIALVLAGPSACSVSFSDFPGVVTAARTIDAAVTLSLLPSAAQRLGL